MQLQPCTSHLHLHVAPSFLTRSTHPVVQTNDATHTVAAQWSTFDEILDKFEEQRQALEWAEEDLEMQ